jgi:hypothetical protein
MTFESPTELHLTIRCERPDWQLSSMSQIFSHQLPLLSHKGHPTISQSREENMGRIDNPDMDSSLLLDLFHLFIAVQSLYISEKLVPPVADAPQKLTGGRTMEVLPVQEGITSLVTARQLFDHPVTIHEWEE